MSPGDHQADLTGSLKPEDVCSVTSLRDVLKESGRDRKEGGRDRRHGGREREETETKTQGGRDRRTQRFAGGAGRGRRNKKE